MSDTQLSISKEKTLRALENAYNLPSIPFIINEVNKVIEDPRASAANLGEVISKDQGLATKILSVANSPLYGIPRRVSTIDFAIIILGFNHIKNIVLAFSIMEAFTAYDSKHFNQKEYWLHSLLTASASKRLADDFGYHISGEAFTAGLLHDLGIAVICKYLPKQYREIVEIGRSGEMSFHDAEMQILGMTHSEIGKTLVDRWNLPPAFGETILYHHSPSFAQMFQVLASLVHLTDYMTARLGVGTFEWDRDYVLDPHVLKYLKLGNDDYLEGLLKTYEPLILEQYETISAF